MDKTVNELKKLKTIFCGTVKDLNKGLKLFTDIPSVNNDALFSPVINAEMIRLSSLIGYLNGMRDYIVALNPEMEQYNNGYIPKEYAEQNEEEKVKICLDIFQNAIHKACMIGAGIVNAELMDYKLAMIKKDEPKFMDFPAGEVHYGRLFKYIYLGELERVKMLSEKHREMAMKQANGAIKNSSDSHQIKYVDLLIGLKKNTDGEYVFNEIFSKLNEINDKMQFDNLGLTIIVKESNFEQVKEIFEKRIEPTIKKHSKEFKKRILTFEELEKKKVNGFQKAEKVLIVCNNAMIQKSLEESYSKL